MDLSKMLIGWSCDNNECTDPSHMIRSFKHRYIEWDKEESER